LIIIDEFPLKSSDKKTDLVEKQEFLEDILEKIPENNIVLFSSANPDKRSKFYKKLFRLAEIKEFNISNDSDNISIILKKYKQKISPDAINLLIKYKA
jgi:DNA polymerase III delta subunit